MRAQHPVVCLFVSVGQVGWLGLWHFVHLSGPHYTCTLLVNLTCVACTNAVFMVKACTGEGASLQLRHSGSYRHARCADDVEMHKAKILASPFD